MDDKRKKIDWEAIEVDFRLGIKSLRAMAEQYGCVEGAIRKQAKKEGWTRDLSAKVKAKADDLVRSEEVRSKVRIESPTEKQQIEIGAVIQKDIILSHRKSIGSLQSVCESMTEELIAQRMSQDEILLLASITSPKNESDEPIDLDKAAAALNKMLALPGRADTFKKLVESKKALVAMEREAFGIDAKGSVIETMEAFLAKING